MENEKCIYTADVHLNTSVTKNRASASSQLCSVEAEGIGGVISHLARVLFLREKKNLSRYSISRHIDPLHHLDNRVCPVR